MALRSGRAAAARSLIGVAAVVAAWWWASAAGADLLPSPAQVSHALLGEIRAGRLLLDVAVSLRRVLCGFVLGATAGLLVGALVAQSWMARAGLWPLLELARPVPPLAWIPVAILWFGIEESSKIFVIALGAFFPVLVSTYFGIRRLDAALIRAARTLGAGPIRVFFAVVLPAALPDIVTGIKSGWALAFISLIAAELVASRSGLGALLTVGRLNDRLDLILAAVIVIGLLGLIADWGMRVAGRYLLVWNLDLDRTTE
jgi:ABC-type nitrate/sulfonate/bicarbonate transport system permease component